MVRSTQPFPGPAARLSDATTAGGQAPSPAPSVEDPGIPDDPSYRYEDLGLIGQGGMGQVRRVRDRDLNCVVAMKIGHTSLMADRRLLARFIAEAQATAQLCHPGIVPVHELGVLPDGRFYFTMKEITGRTLRQAIDEAHMSDGQSALAVDGAWRLHRLVDVFHRVCEAVAYAHARGVVHRDLKPDNVMLGEWGEVLVLDWGLAKAQASTAFGDLPPAQPVVTNRSSDAVLQTAAGIVAGTPYYMPPEQARGEFLSLGPEADVYALGAMLYEILHGAPPWANVDRKGLVEHVAAGHTLPVRVPPTPPRPGKPPPPPDLLDICEAATRPRAPDRFAHAGPLADSVRAWLDGARNRDRALEMVARARVLQRSVSVLRRQAVALRAEATEALEALPFGADAEEKAPLWDLQDQASALDQEVAQKEAEALTLLHGAALDVPNLDAAHQLLADHYRERHAEAESRRDTARADRLEVLLRVHDRGRHTDYLEGYGRVSLLTDAPRAKVALYQYHERQRRLVATSLGREVTAPLVNLSLPRGSYLFVIRAEGRAEVRYPVLVGRQEHWDGVPPSASSPRKVHLPESWQLTHRDAYVPAGWFRTDAADDSPHRVWVDGVVIRRRPVTCDDYLVFVNDLVEEGQIALAERLVPLRPPRLGEAGPLFLRDDGGHYVHADPSAAGLPVTMLGAQGAEAYAAWYADRTGEGWRLPTEWEWEKAARGVDGRRFPWGDFFDASFCCMRDSYEDGDGRSPFDAFPADESPYGVSAMAGVVMELCSDTWRDSPTATDQGYSRSCRVARGGSWRSSASETRASARTRVVATHPRPDLGFRLVRSLDAP